MPRTLFEPRTVRAGHAHGPRAASRADLHHAGFGRASIPRVGEVWARDALPATRGAA
jgi:hypothetical protein